ncbi:HlyD family efflux transporter periplasmic adaptor subunit [Calothrix sp. NIES-3974]|uniref:HlyD family efflux transporter periplasmic adaptor subunit n=1 Tax=Calothrix sp. NIES-3974 TaxID=2005462 RepID=UPI000B6232D8|nr:HlyD family efflux transporter periplasmic adaptor subunit [Calothrix sp. NIES-3974]BAZ07509.1 HlyD family secretion protein [Calothrix sp. NIES-3974]
MTIIIKSLIDDEILSPEESTILHLDSAPPFRNHPIITSSCQPTLEPTPEIDTHKFAQIYGGAVTSIAPPNPAKQHTESVREPPSLTPTGNWSTSLQTTLDRPPASLPQQILIGGITFVVAFATWATLGSLDEVGKASGILIPEGETYKINPVINGKITQIYVQEGQTVKAGQIIAEIDDRATFTEIQRLQQEQNTLQTELIQTNALIDKTQLEAQTQNAIARSEQLAHQQTINAAKARLQASREILTQLRNQQTANLHRQTQLQPLLEKSRQLLQQRQKEIAIYQERVENLRPLLEQGAISKEAFIQVEQAVRDRELAIAKSQLEETPMVRDRLFEAEQTSAQITRTITQNQGEIAQTEREIYSLQATLSQKQAQAVTIQVQAQQKLQQLKIQRTQIMGKIRDNQKQQEQLKTQIQHHKLTAPVDGVILALNVRNPGEVVQPGQTIAQIAPPTAPLILQAILPNREAGFVQPGDPAQLKFDAFPYQDYGIIPGKVISISPDAKLDERLGAVYRVEIEINQNHISTNNKPIKLKPGQTATAEIITRHRRIIDVILDPIRQIQNSSINL